MHAKIISANDRVPTYGEIWRTKPIGTVPIVVSSHDYPRIVQFTDYPSSRFLLLNESLLQCDTAYENDTPKKLLGYLKINLE